MSRSLKTQWYAKVRIVKSTELERKQITLQLLKDHFGSGLENATKVWSKILIDNCRVTEGVLTESSVKQLLNLVSSDTNVQYEILVRFMALTGVSAEEIQPNQTVDVSKFHEHPLDIHLTNKYYNGNNIFCDVCKLQVISSQILLNCKTCSWDSHPSCCEIINVQFKPQSPWTISIPTVRKIQTNLSMLIFFFFFRIQVNYLLVVWLRQ